jgi:hypothetical protein
LSFFRGETVTIKRRSATATDEYGNKTYSMTTITVKDCLIGFGGGSEDVEPNREPQDSRLTIYMPNGVQIEPGDRFVIRGTEFIKDSMDAWVSPFVTPAGVVVQVKRRDG